MKIYNKLFKEITQLLVGNALLAIAVGVFILPQNILSGGVAGVAVLLEPFVDIPKEITVSIVTISLFFVGLVLLGKSFALKTLASSILYPLFLNIVILFEFNIELNPLLASVYGGLIAGIALGIVIRGGASTGGMDIPALVLHKYLKKDVSIFVMIVDAITVGFGLFIYGLEPVLIGLLSVFATSFGIAKVMEYPWDKVMSVTIISKEWKEINDKINSELDRGSTLMDAVGGYTKDEKTVILVIVNNDQYDTLLNIVHAIDKNAFVIANETNKVHGEGFSLHTRI